MPMVVSSPRVEWKRREDAATDTDTDTDTAPAVTAEVEPAPVTPAESAYRNREAVNERRLAKRAKRRAAA